VPAGYEGFHIGAHFGGPNFGFQLKMGNNHQDFTFESPRD
jgi:hypothetical protein